jgi:hypothetical protein
MYSQPNGRQIERATAILSLETPCYDEASLSDDPQIDRARMSMSHLPERLFRLDSHERSASLWQQSLVG